MDVKSRAILAGWGYLKENATIDSLTDIPFETRITALQIHECVAVPLLKRIINKEQMFCGIGKDTDACQVSKLMEFVFVQLKRFFQI